MIEREATFEHHRGYRETRAVEVQRGGIEERIGFRVIGIVRAVPSLARSVAPSLRQILSGRLSPQLLNAINKSPQIVKELGEANRLVVQPNTYLNGLDSLDNFATANGWRIVGEGHELVHFNSPRAFTEVDEATKTIRIYLTAESGSSVRVVEFADEISHAVNAIQGKPNANSMGAHVTYFDDAANSTLIPYTPQERAALTTARNVLEQFADEFDGA